MCGKEIYYAVVLGEPLVLARHLHFRPLFPNKTSQISFVGSTVSADSYSQQDLSVIKFAKGVDVVSTVSSSAVGDVKL